MDTNDNTEKLAKVFKYGKYVVLVVLILIIFLVIKSCTFSYSKVEKTLVEYAKEYVKLNNISVHNELFIEAYKLEIVKGTELCKKTSGVIVKNDNGELKYKTYLDCPDYKSTLGNKEKYIKLNGSDVIFINKGELYEEPGYENLQGAYIEELKENSDSNIFSINYDAYVEDIFKERVVRKIVTVSDNKDETITGLKNTEEPVVTLKGEQKMTLSLNSKYTEPGYVAYDYNDGKISRQVVVKGKVDTTKVGTYNLIYSITNSKGKTVIVGRQVDVVKKVANLDVTLSYDDKISSSIIIEGKVTGSGFKEVRLPNGATVDTSNFKYTVGSDGLYSFTIYDIYGNFIAKEIEVKGIDITAPTGTCTADYRTKSVTISVDAKDNKGISGYEYLVGSEKIYGSGSELVKAGNFSKNNVFDIRVNVLDIAGNVATLDCKKILNLEPTMYRDSLGYDCLEPYTCYKQKDYSDPYQATSNGVGTIYRSGCLPTSLTIISTKFDKRSKNGELYTPPTLIKEVIYPDGKIKGYSNYKRVKEVADALNLKISEEYKFKANVNILTEHLKTGNPALILVTKGCLAAGGHYMAILGINDKNQVFLSDPNSRTNKSAGSCPVNTWVDLDTLTKGGASIETFVLFNE